jgi:GTP-binding protein
MSAHSQGNDIVAIVGRPNVGKSTLFNQLVGRRIAITDPTAGTTRDRIFHPLSWHDADGVLRRFELMDTGGLGIVDHQDLSTLVEHQIEVGIAGADLLVLMMDAQNGVTPHDREIATRLRKTGLPLILAANKCDNDTLREQSAEFYNLGLDGDVVAISAVHRRGMDDLLDTIVEHLPPLPDDFDLEANEKEDPVRPGDADTFGDLKLAIVGRRNVGKSTFVNALVGDERVIASDTPGTTRDSIDVRLERDGRTVILIDTAGLRRRRSLASTIEFFALARTERAITRADVVVLMLDSEEGISQVDKSVAEQVREEAKTCILAVNKWDKSPDDASLEDYEEYLDRALPQLAFAPLSFTSAINAINIWETVTLAEELAEKSRRRHPTGEVNRILRNALAAHSPPARRSKLPKAYYATQIGVQPPRFALFVNEKRLFAPDYVRYLEKRLKLALDLEEIPIRIVLKNRKEKSAPGHNRRRAKGSYEPEPEQILTREGLEHADRGDSIDLDNLSEDGPTA